MKIISAIQNLSFPAFGINPEKQEQYSGINFI